MTDKLKIGTMLYSYGEDYMIEYCDIQTSKPDELIDNYRKEDGGRFAASVANGGLPIWLCQQKIIAGPVVATVDDHGISFDRSLPHYEDDVEILAVTQKGIKPVSGLDDLLHFTNLPAMRGTFPLYFATGKGLPPFLAFIRKRNGKHVIEEATTPDEIAAVADDLCFILGDWDWLESKIGRERTKALKMKVEAAERSFERGETC